MLANVLQWVQIFPALIIGYLVHENGKTQVDMLEKSHKAILDLFVCLSRNFDCPVLDVPLLGMDPTAATLPEGRQRRSRPY